MADAFDMTCDLDDYKPVDTAVLYDSRGGDVDGLINHMVAQSKANRELQEPDTTAKDIADQNQPLPKELSTNFDMGSI
ncbi:hypothetical protein [Aeromonas caviae]|uniref:hypothetical protein n=1 Tax=Aeromonas caviae TaxID=648 RepID=UPI003F7A11C1